MDRYRYNKATGDVYEYSERAKAYIFIGNVGHRSFDQFLKDQDDGYEEGLDEDDPY